MSLLLATAPLAALGGALGLEAALRRRDLRRHPPPGRMVDVGGHALHARVLGSADPVVVLEAASGAWSASWDRMPERLSEHATVVAYDRAGLGWSAPGPGPRTAQTLSSELHGLLRELVPDRPIVLVAHGAGARVAWSFAARYPFQVAGLVAVDGEHGSLDVELGGEGVTAPTVSGGALRWLDVAGRLGVLRALGFTPPLPNGLPATTVEVLRALAPRGLAAVRAEEHALREDAQPGASPEVPTRVLIARESLPREGTPDDFPRDTYNRLWARASARLATISSRADVGEVEGDHFFHVSHPQVVEEAVREVLAAARD